MDPGELRIKSMLLAVRNEAMAAYLFRGDLLAIGVIGFLDKLEDDHGNIKDDVWRIASEVLVEDD